MLSAGNRSDVITLLSSFGAYYITIMVVFTLLCILKDTPEAYKTQCLLLFISCFSLWSGEDRLQIYSLVCIKFYFFVCPLPFLFPYLLIFLFVCLFVCLSLYFLMCFFFVCFLLFCLFVCLFACLVISLFVRLSVCLSRNFAICSLVC